MRTVSDVPRRDLLGPTRPDMYYANDKKDAAEIGFDDSFIYDEFALAPSARSLPSERMLPDEAIRAFELWRDQEDKTPY